MSGHPLISLLAVSSPGLGHWVLAMLRGTEWLQRIYAGVEYMMHSQGGMIRLTAIATALALFIIWWRN
ncbi:MAG: hypothetical protein JO112_16775 [Planctomycetes bacterium]|nr:hypothetical protein [Planctomycetota bacterium]